MIATLVAKDYKLFFRNQFFAVVTGLSIVIFVALYFLIPDSVDESVGIALYFENPDLVSFDDVVADNEDFTVFDNEAEMIAAIEESGDFLAGVSFPEEDVIAMLNGEEVILNAYYTPGIASEVKQIYNDVMLLIANAANPEVTAALDGFEIDKVVLGNDLLGAPLSFRDRILPMLFLVILSVELLGLATLINREVDSGTLRALITGPLRLHQFFASKALMGLTLAFSQLLLIVIITGKITTSPLLLLTTLMLGSFSFVGIGFLVAAVAKDNTSVMAWGAFILILFLIPAISIMLPGLATGWMELIPSFFMVDALHRILNFNAGWADVGRHLVILFVTGAGVMALGTSLLRRRF